MSRRFSYFNWYEPTVPKEVVGGIKARNKRGAFASKWWGKRWIQTLESFNIGARLARGRSYARKGQVASLEIARGKVAAKVQGSSSSAYRVSIELKTFSRQQWQEIIEKLIEQPIFTAQLLGNEMPEDIESVFSEMKISLFPVRHHDLTTECSCPDWSNPCKHIAAVLYLMAEAFDQDPFLIFNLRGMTRDELLKALQDSGATKESDVNLEPEREDLPVEPDEFWQNEIIENPRLNASLPVQLHAALPKRLGPLPFWRSEKDFINELEIFYAKTLLAVQEILEKVS